METDFEIKYCPVCDCKEYTDFIVDLRYCTRCGHMYKKFHVSSKYYENYVSSAARGIRTASSIRTAIMRCKVLTAFKQSGKLLEIGCGHQNFLDVATENGFECEGTELSVALQKLLDYKIHVGNPTELKSKLGTYDVICAFHVLEHLNNPLEEVRTLVEMLNDDGVMILEFPGMFFYDLELHPTDFYEGLHTQYFNQTSLMIFLKRCGLKIIYQNNFWDGTISSALLCAVKESADIKTRNFQAINFMSGVEMNE